MTRTKATDTQIIIDELRSAAERSLQTGDTEYTARIGEILEKMGA